MVGLPSSPVVTSLYFLLLSSTVSPLSGVLFSTLPRTLTVSASPNSGQVLRAGEDKIRVWWGLNQSLPPGTDSGYKTVRATLCYAPVSQADRPWRATADDLARDKACPFTISVRPYADGASATSSFEYALGLDIPTAAYFVRAYAVDSGGGEVGYGESAGDPFGVVGVSGRCLTLDFAAWCFSACSVVGLLVFLVADNRKKYEALAEEATQ